MGDGSFKSQLKRADKSGARYAVIVGENEARQSEFILKNLRHDAEQKTYACSQFIKTIKPLFQ
jgi:histidyl-tRNA synthetase